jgi:hypothetical protein
MMHWALAIVAWLVAVAVLAPAMFFVAIVMAGPHSSMLPSVMQPVVLVVAWVVVLAGPLVVAHRVWRRTSSRATGVIKVKGTEPS